MEQLSVQQTSSPDLVLPVRRASFESRLAALPKHFARNDNLFESHQTMVLSSLFPDGEDFFVRSVRHYRSEITDPVLRKQVSAFIGQESVHGREHRSVNERFDELGYPALRFQGIAAKFFPKLTKLVPALDALAITAAIEHFTAVLAEEILTEDDVRSRFGDGAMRDVFEWHALEESEHKAVAFDVYRAVGGDEKLRIGAFKITRVLFYTIVALFTLLSLVRDPAARSPRRLRRDFREFRGSALYTRRFRDGLAEYERIGFHPNDRNTDALVAAWRDELFGDDGRLSPLLAA